ncbi:MAG: RNA-binding protein [Alphaproteobacteria bacterium]
MSEETAVEAEEAELPPEIEDRKSPERTCLVTRMSKPKGELIRFVVGPKNVIVADLTGKLPGRGYYLTNSRLIVAEAIAKKSLSRATGGAQPPFDFLNRLEELMATQVKNALSLARKAGQVIAGFEKVENALHEGKVAALIHAPGAGADGLKKLRADGIPTFDSLPREWLDEVLGRENTVHVAVLQGPAAPFFIETARRFALFLA